MEKGKKINYEWKKQPKYLFINHALKSISRRKLAINYEVVTNMCSENSYTGIFKKRTGKS